MSNILTRFRSLAWLWLTGLKENVRFAMVALVGHKLRSALTILGIVIGVTTVIAMVSIIEGFNNNVRQSFESFGATLVQFQKFDPRFGPGGPSDSDRARKNLTYEDALAIKRLSPSMAAVSPERYWFSGGDSGAPTLHYKGNEGTPDTIVGVTQDYPIANNHYVNEGRFVLDSDLRHSASVVVLGHGIAEALFPRTDPLGKDAQPYLGRWAAAAFLSGIGVEAIVGDLAEVLPLAEPVLELEVHSNRVDCFGVYGVAREVHAVTGRLEADPRQDEEHNGDDVENRLRRRPHSADGKHEVPLLGNAAVRVRRPGVQMVDIGQRVR